MIEVLKANPGAYALERQHVGELAAGHESSAWNEETQEWGHIEEADYEQGGIDNNDEENKEEGQDGRSESDMDIDSDEN